VDGEVEECVWGRRAIRSREDKGETSPLPPANRQGNWLKARHITQRKTRSKITEEVKKSSAQDTLLVQSGVRLLNVLKKPEIGAVGRGGVRRPCLDHRQAPRSP